MPRARNIKPGFFANEDLAELEPMGRLLFIGLWTLADREGRLEDRPKRIKGELFPYDNCDVDSLLNDLEQWGFIKRYQSQGVKCIQVINFSKHQNPHPREAKSVLPAYESEPNQEKDVPRHDLGTDKDIPSREKELPSHEKAQPSPADILNPNILITDTLNPDTGTPNKTTTTGNRARARFIEENCEEDGWRDVAKAYSDNVHPVSGNIENEKLYCLFTEYGKAWMLAAISEAIESSKGPPSMRYIAAILERWKRDGFRSDGRKRRSANPQINIVNGALAMLNEMEE